MAEKTYLHAMYPKLAPQIDQALNEGISLDTIHDTIGQKINYAKKEGIDKSVIRETIGMMDEEAPTSYNPFLAQAYQAASAFNKGLGTFTKGMIEPGQYVSEKLGFGRSKLFDYIVDQAMSVYKENSEYWEEKAKQKGAGFLDELIGDAVGGGMTGIPEFMLNIPYATAQGAVEAKSQGQSELLGATVGAVKRGILGKLFHLYGQLSKPLAAAAMGGTMGLETAAAGGSPEEVAKATGTGALYSLGGNGRIGIRQLRDLRGEYKYEPFVRTDEQIALDREKQRVEEQKAAEKPAEEVQPAVVAPTPEVATVETPGNITAIYYDRTGREMVRGAIEREETQPYSHMVRSRMEEGMAHPDYPYVPEINTYAAGSLERASHITGQGRLPKIPHAITFPESLVYDTMSDPLGILPQVKEAMEQKGQVGNEALWRNILANKVKDAGYGGYYLKSAKEPTERVILLFGERPAQPAQEFTAGVSQEIQGEGYKSPTTVKELFERGKTETPKLIQHVTTSLQNFPEVTLVDSRPQYYWGTESGGMMEPSVALTLKGPENSVKAALAYLGLTRNQNSVYIQPAGESKEPNNGVFVRFKVKVNDPEKIYDEARQSGLKDINLSEENNGNDLYVNQFVFGGDEAQIRSLGELHKRYGEGEIRHSDIYAELIEKDSYKQHILNYYGKEGENYYARGVEEGRKYVEAYQQGSADIPRYGDTSGGRPGTGEAGYPQPAPGLGGEAPQEVAPSKTSYDTFIENAVGATKARKETLLIGKIGDIAGQIKEQVQELARHLKIATVIGDPNAVPTELIYRGIEGEKGLKAQLKTPGSVEKELTNIIDLADRASRAAWEEAEKIGKQELAEAEAFSRKLSSGLMSEAEQKAAEAERFSRKATNAAYVQGKRDGALAEYARKKAAEEIKKNLQGLKKEVNDRLDNIRKRQDANIDPDYRDQINDILSDYDLRVRSEKTLRTREATREFIERQRAAGELILIPDRLIDMVGRKAVNDMTLDELRDLDDLTARLVHLGKLKKELVSAQEHRSMERAKADVITEMDSTRYGRDVELPEKPLPPSGRKLTRWQEFKSGVDRFFHMALKIENIVERLGGFKGVDSKSYKNLFKPIKDAEDASIKLGLEDAAKLTDAFSLIKEELRSPDKETIDGFSFTRPEAIAIYLNSKNKDNLRTLTEGFGLTTDTIQRIVDTLRPNELEFANKIFEILNDKFDSINKVKKKLTGESVEKVDWYYPIYFDRELSEMAARRELEDNLMQDVYTRTSVGRGFTESRTHTSKDAPLLDLKVIPIHLAKVNHFITHALPVRDVQRMILDKDIKSAIIKNSGDNAYGEFMPWLKDVANPKGGPYNEVDRIVGMIRHNATMVSLGLKLSTALMQPMAYFQTINRLGFGNAMAGLADFYKDPYRITNEIYEMSPSMKTRRNNYDRDLKDLMMSAEGGKFLTNHKMKEAFYYMMTTLDLMTTLPTWHSAFLTDMRKTGGDRAHAIEYADSIARQTQSSGMPKDLARIQRGSELQKAFVMFYTYFSSTLNEAVKDMRMYKSGQHSVGEMMGSFMWLFIIPALMQAVVRHREETGAKEIGQEIVQNVTASIPIVGSMFNSLTSDYDYQASPIFQAPEAAVKMGKAGGRILSDLVSNATVEDKDISQFAKNAIMSAGYLKGLPSRQVILTGQWLGDMLENRSYDPMNLIYRKQEK